MGMTAGTGAAQEPFRPERGAVALAGDPGRQIERTVLAWHRTAAAFLVAAVAAARLLTPVVGGWAYPAAMASALCMFVVVATGRRIAPLRRPSATSATLPAVLPRPGWMAAVAAATCLTGFAAVAAALAGGV